MTNDANDANDVNDANDEIQKDIKRDILVRDIPGTDISIKDI